MEKLKAQLQKKQALIILLMGVVLVLSFSAVSTTTTYLYRSRADENPDIQRTEQDSIAIQIIDTRLYACIKNLSFLPDENGNGCFAQFECNGQVENVSQNCSQKNETVSCMSPTSKCNSRQEWLDQVKSMCGC